MHFNQYDAISLLNGCSLKLVDQFVYSNNNISSTESNVNIHIVKTENAIEILLIICKYHLPDQKNENSSKL